MKGLRSEGGVASLDMLIGSTIFLLAFFTVIYIIVSMPVGTQAEGTELRYNALRTTDLLIRDSGWYDSGSAPNVTSIGPSGSYLEVERIGNRSADEVNWEAHWDTSDSPGYDEVERLGLMARYAMYGGTGPAPGDGKASLENGSLRGVLSIQKLDGVENGTWNVEGLMLRHPPTALSKGEAAANGSWWWDFGEDASHDVSSGDDVSDAEYENATRALGLSKKGFEIYAQVRPVNGSLYNESAADEAVRRNVPEDDEVAKVERLVLVLRYDRSKDVWDYVRVTDERPVWYRFVLYLW